MAKRSTSFAATSLRFSGATGSEVIMSGAATASLFSGLPDAVGFCAIADPLWFCLGWAHPLVAPEQTRSPALHLRELKKTLSWRVRRAKRWRARGSARFVPRVLIVR
jgi:hypothetical protein